MSPEHFSLAGKVQVKVLQDLNVWTHLAGSFALSDMSSARVCNRPELGTDPPASSMLSKCELNVPPVN